MLALHEMLALTSPEKSYGALRQRLRSLQEPCVPYVGMYLSDLVGAEEGKENLTDGLINFAKHRRIAIIIKEVQQYQLQAHTFGPIEAVKVRCAPHLPPHGHNRDGRASWARAPTAGWNPLGGGGSRRGRAHAGLLD